MEGPAKFFLAPSNFFLKTSVQEWPKWCFWSALGVLGGLPDVVKNWVLEVIFRQFSDFGLSRPGPAGVFPPGGGRLASPDFQLAQLSSPATPRSLMYEMYDLKGVIFGRLGFYIWGVCVWGGVIGLL